MAGRRPKKSDDGRTAAARPRPEGRSATATASGDVDPRSSSSSSSSSRMPALTPPVAVGSQPSPEPRTVAQAAVATSASSATTRDARDVDQRLNMPALAASLPPLHQDARLPPSDPHQLSPDALAAPAAGSYSFPSVTQFSAQAGFAAAPSAGWGPASNQAYLPYYHPGPAHGVATSHMAGYASPMSMAVQASMPPTVGAGAGQAATFADPAFLTQAQHARIQQYGYAPGSLPMRAPAGHPTAYGRRAGPVASMPAPAGATGASNLPQRRPSSVPAGRGRGGDASSSVRTNILRGPPRKPRQSGHALWVGNLPSGTNVVELKDHFARDATEDIESVFLITKSNCAFVNYKTEAACAAAMRRFHDSRFRGVRLVCRLRRNSASPGTGAGAEAGSESDGASASASASASLSAPPSEAERHSAPAVLAVPAGHDGTPGESATSGKASEPSARERYFVLKSLTVEDLELSVKNGVWATQAHNEPALNRAFETADEVFLIFSANKSGEYFGYARMASNISDESAATLEWTPQTPYNDEALQPEARPTPATAFAPRGRVIDDSARGTIFWEVEAESDAEEAEEDEGEEEEAEEEEGGPEDDEAEAEIEGVAVDGLSDEGEADRGKGKESESARKAWGRPFRIEWLSTGRLPFYRTRGLRNAWNANREVKIARDGTELEPTVGRRLVQMFHLNVSPITAMPPAGPGGVGRGSFQRPAY